MSLVASAATNQYTRVTTFCDDVNVRPETLEVLRNTFTDIDGVKDLKTIENVPGVSSSPEYYYSVNATEKLGSEIAKEAHQAQLEKR